MKSYPKVPKVQEVRGGRQRSKLSRILRGSQRVPGALGVQQGPPVLVCHSRGTPVNPAPREGPGVRSQTLLWGPQVRFSRGCLVFRRTLPPPCLPSFPEGPGHHLTPSLPLKEMSFVVPAAQEDLSLPFPLYIPSDSYLLQQFHQDYESVCSGVLGGGGTRFLWGS